MDINKHIIDQRIKKIVEDKPDWFADIPDNGKRISRAFVLLAVSSYLMIDLTEANSLLTDGGGDQGVDAISIGDISNLEFQVIIFQGKYKTKLETDANFPANEVQKVANSIWSIFDSEKELNNVNPTLRSEINEIRSRIADGYIPIVKVVLFNNGLKWNDEGEQHIINAKFPKDQVEFEHINHENIVDFIQTSKEINAPIKLSGASFVENFNYKRVLVGKVNVTEIAKLFDNHGDALLEKNIRRYLGLNRNRVNEAIKNTLVDDSRENFYFKNNGITVVCKKISYNALQKENWDVRLEDFQIINGGQTCKTIQHTINENQNIDYSQVYVLFRVYELSVDDEEKENLVNDITLATNSQNPVDLSDLRSNDKIQRNLETDIEQLGYNYRRKRDISSSKDSVIPLSVAAQAIYAIWKGRPNLAKFKRKELFGALYDKVYTNDLNAAQVVLAVLIYRFCDSQRRKVELIEKYPHIPYSNYFMAMIIGKLIIKDQDTQLSKITHKNFKDLKSYFEDNKTTLFERANDILITALNDLYQMDYKDLEMMRLSAAFRRGDLYNKIEI